MAQPVQSTPIKYSRGLKDCVKHLYKKYGRRLDPESELPMKQLLVIAMVKERDPLTVSELAAALWGCFPTVGVDAFEDLYAFQRELNEALRDYDAGFVETPETMLGVKSKGVFTISDDDARHALREYMVPVPDDPLHAMHVRHATSLNYDPLFLSDHSEDRRTSFLDLPPELRNIIYKLILLGPKSGMIMQENAAALAVTRDPNATARFEDFSTYTLERPPNDGEPCRRPYDIDFADRLTILATSKQVRSEALPIVYGQNHFHARNVHEGFPIFVSHQSTIPNYFHDVSVAWKKERKEYAAKLFEGLKRNNVKKLGIWMLKEWWVRPHARQTPVRHQRIYENVKGIPGMATLVRPLHLADYGVDHQFEKVVIQGDWREFAVYIRDHADFDTIKHVEFEGNEVQKS